MTKNAIFPTTCHKWPGLACSHDSDSFILIIFLTLVFQMYWFIALAELTNESYSFDLILSPAWCPQHPVWSHDSGAAAANWECNPCSRHPPLSHHLPSLPFLRGAAGSCSSPTSTAGGRLFGGRATRRTPRCTAGSACHTPIPRPKSRLSQLHPRPCFFSRVNTKPTATPATYLHPTARPTGRNECEPSSRVILVAFNGVFTSLQINIHHVLQMSTCYCSSAHHPHCPSQQQQQQHYRPPMNSLSYNCPQNQNLSHHQGMNTDVFHKLGHKPNTILRCFMQR